jgi:hypothetical protein
VTFPCKRAYALSFAAAAALLLQATRCGFPSAVAVYRYGLTNCPDTAFTLPKRVVEGPYDVSSGKRHRWSTPQPPMCTGFTFYEVRGESGPWGLNVRLNRGPSCRLDVAYAHELPRERERQAQVIREFDALLGGKIDDVAQLVLRGSGVAPLLPPAQVERVPGADLDAWCARMATPPQ